MTIYPAGLINATETFKIDFKHGGRHHIVSCGREIRRTLCTSTRKWGLTVPFSHFSPGALPYVICSFARMKRVYSHRNIPSSACQKILRTAQPFYAKLRKMGNLAHFVACGREIRRTLCSSTRKWGLTAPFSHFSPGALPYVICFFARMKRVYSHRNIPSHNSARRCDSPAFNFKLGDTNPPFLLWKRRAPR